MSYNCCMNRKRVNGKFYSDGEPNTERIAVRVPPSIYLDVIDASNGEIAKFVRDAIAEKLQRSTNQKSA